MVPVSEKGKISYPISSLGGEFGCGAGLVRQDSINQILRIRRGVVKIYLVLKVITFERAGSIVLASVIFILTLRIF